ncbi:MAG: hypothetical protein UFG06_13980 [Lachnospiraceae bacterium]|nr:hypothetical protein [Lachnospiraceae bacterium]
MNNKRVTVIKVRRGLNGFKYSACRENGEFIGNFAKLADVRRHWAREIRWGVVLLVRELDKLPDTSQLDECKKTIESILKSYAKK